MRTFLIHGGDKRRKRGTEADKDLKRRQGIYIMGNVGMFPGGNGFTCHLSSYSFHILVATFGAETLLDWPVPLFFSSGAVRIFVTASAPPSELV